MVSVGPGDDGAATADPLEPVGAAGAAVVPDAVASPTPPRKGEEGSLPLAVDGAAAPDGGAPRP